uniref:Dipeptidyl-peptidase 2 n=1 Tax=Magallana gigas TaxID=29159 RepID=K1PUR0_MAGGI
MKGVASIVVVCLTLIFTNAQTVPFKELYIDQYVDHFNFVSYGETIFKERYLLQDQWWKPGVGPIFFYTGNEGSIEEFWDNTGFVFDIAPEFNALVVFAEHMHLAGMDVESEPKVADAGTGLYSLAWINVDHYLAIRKPQRHKVAMTTTRSLCWIIFVWIGAVSFCSPTLFSFKKQAKYYEEVFLCTINAGSHKPYFVTAGILVILPAFFALVSTNAYLFTKSFRKKRHMYQTILIDTASRPNNYFMNFIISMIFLIAWIPWLVLQIYGEFIEKVSDYPHSIHFYLLWFGIGNSFYKFFVYLLWSRDFRRGLRQLCCHNDCKCSKCSMPQSVSLNFVTANAGK